MCIPYYNLGAYLPDLLTSLARQTTQDFNVFVVNDGSTDPKSIDVFEEMKREYKAYQNWAFVSTKNQGVCEARNLAASLGNAEYICFADSDNIAAPNMVERFLEGIRRSGDDCLACYMHIFKEGELASNSSGFPYPASFHYIPYGNFPVLGMMQNPFGDGNCIMRRSAFEAMGGFTTDFPHEINHEDRELLTRLSLTGYKLDIIPEFLLYYRERRDSRLRTTDMYLNEMRVLRHYQERLREVGLEDVAPLLVGLNYRVQEGGYNMADQEQSTAVGSHGVDHMTVLGLPSEDKIARFEREFDIATTSNLIDYLSERFKPEVEITMDDIRSQYPHYLKLLEENPTVAAFVDRYVDILQPFLQAPFPVPGNRVIQGPWAGLYKIGHFTACEVTSETLAGKRVLDIGCNAGFDTLYLSTLGAREVIGIEPTPLFYYQALMLWATYNCPNVDYLRVGWQQLKESSLGTFDLINCQGVLYHEPNPLLLVETIFDHLAPGGKLVLETHVTMDTDTKAHFVENTFWGDSSWWWVPSVPTVCAMLRVYGFENITVRAHYPVESKNPEDKLLTPEGNPAGGRAFLTATRPITPVFNRPKVGWTKS
jgi:GT2 family glycosyltransferase/SAM-dependent methyltransferase